MSVAAYHGLWKVDEDFIVSYAKSSTEVDILGVDFALIVVSISISVLGYVSEFFLLWLHAQDVPSLAKMLSYQAMLIMTYFADVTLFCALWQVEDELILPRREVYSNLITHVGGILVRILVELLEEPVVMSSLSHTKNRLSSFLA